MTSYCYDVISHAPRGFAGGALRRPGATGRIARVLPPVLWACWLVSVAAAAESRAAEGAKPAGRLASALARARAHEQAGRGVVGLSVVDLRTGLPALSYHADQPKAPASNQKLLTSAFALTRLGPKFRFCTRVCARGKDVWILGDGDPTLGDPRLADEAGVSIYYELDRWARAIREHAGAALEGDLVLVPLAGPKARPIESGLHPDWPAKQRHRWYMAPASGLNFHDNCYDVTWTVTAARITPHVAPASSWIRVANEVTRGKGQTWSLTPAPDDSRVTLRGTVRQSSTDPISVPVSQPPVLLARVLADRLARAGVTLGGEIKIAAGRPRDLAGEPEAICTTTTPIATALARANKRSLNMAAECLLLRAGDGTWAGSAKAMTAMLTKTFELPAGAVSARDGSGLSDRDRVTPSAMTTILARLAGGAAAETFLSSLSVAGVDGTLRHRMRSAAMKGRVLGKTGFILGVCCLSGYVLDKDKTPALAFSILVNKTPAAWRTKQMQDAVLADLVRYVDE